ADAPGPGGAARQVRPRLQGVPVWPRLRRELKSPEGRAFARAPIRSASRGHDRDAAVGAVEEREEAEELERTERGTFPSSLLADDVSTRCRPSAMTQRAIASKHGGVSRRPRSHRTRRAERKGL